MSDKVKASLAEIMRNPKRPPLTRSEFPQSHNSTTSGHGPPSYRPAATTQEAKGVEEEKT